MCYNLPANVVDDHHMGITHVFRGVEWLISTPKHLALYNAFKWKPPYFAHLPLIMNSDGTKLSKRQGEGNCIHLEEFREKGYYSDAMINFITLTGGGFRDRDFGSDTLYSLQELIDKFQCTLLKTHSSKIEFERLDILNQKSLRRKLLNREPIFKSPSKVSTERRRSLDYSVLTEAKAVISRAKNTKEIDVDDDTLLKRLRWLVKEGRIAKLSDLSESKDFLFLWSEPDIYTSYGIGVNASIIKDVIQKLKPIDEEDFYAANLSDKVRQVAKRHKKSGLKIAELMSGIRLALSGLKEGPPVGEMLEQLGISTSLYRLQKAANSMEI